jgi:outer membrane protein assembly factor BamE
MRPIAATAFAIPFLAVLLGGCGLVYRQPVHQGNLVDATDLGKLEAGMSRQQVGALLGTPSVQDPFHHDRWDYVSSRRTGRSGDAETATLTLYFENDRLARWEGTPLAHDDQALVREMRRSFGANAPRERKR